MQEDMRLKLPAASEPEPERAEVRIVIGMDTQSDGEAAYVVYHPVPKAKAGTLRERLNEIIDERRACQGDVPHQPIAPPPDVLESMLANMRRVGPVVTAAFVDGRMKVFHDGGPAPDSPWQHVMDAQQNEADRIMVRAVEPSHPGPDDDRDTWVLDPGATGHRAPFGVEDFVIRSSGREGIHRVVEVWTDGDAPRHRSLVLKVAPTDVVVDADAF